MKADAVRDIVFAHAMETAAPSDALPDAARREAITQEVLHALGQPATEGRAGQAAFGQFLQTRAAHIIAASNLPADVRQLWQAPPAMARWAPAAILMGALVAGFVSHRITDPHRVDLLSLSLLGIVLWNLLVYLWTVLHGTLRLARPRRQAIAVLQPSQSAPAATDTPGDGPPGWLQRLRGKAMPGLRGTALRLMALAFERNWWQISRPARHAQWLLWLHLGAAAMAAGALASLWITGLTREYQVGWESTFLSAGQVQQWLNALFAPTQWLQLTSPWSLSDIQPLQGWVANDRPAATGAQLPAMGVGERWVWAYTALLAVLVIVPRLLLALWQGLRWRWLVSHMALPLNQPYFASLQRDFGGLATQLVIVPYSMEITPERKAAVEHHAATLYGAGAGITWRPSLAYGAALPDMAAVSPAQTVLLVNLAATPEAEIHAELLAQLHKRHGSSSQLWLWTADFAARNSGAPRRLQEREALWHDFASQNGFTAHLVSAASS
ncbi:DUF2868 domain-containing protein [Comamonas odontotermitis]|uniref:DUF2868 domain-containing protein n=1 Tax=Comamonas odontotermitis TaxID=379895 RepID=UPI001CC715C6|nr:DUF2868 domain-containing protein [Comamonas odontotermitis]UBB17328.1 DUF2868 domain-containing protein [Comamonas odontotermitis]